MSWENIRFVVPDKIQQALDLAEPELIGKASTLPGVMDALAAKPVIDVANPNAIPTDGPFVGNPDFYLFAKNEFKTVVVHPWVEGIGQGVGHYRYLSPRNAIKTLADKLVDPNDDFSPVGKLDYFAILLTGNSYAELGITLQRFLAVYSEPTVYMCARRCGQLARLESEKTILPGAAINSRWDLFTESASNGWRHYTEVVGQPHALYAAYKESDKSLEEAVGVVAKKKAAEIDLVLEIAKHELQAIQLGIGKTLFIKFKTPAEAAKVLRESDVGPESPLSVAFMYAGVEDSLNNLFRLFSQ